MEFVQVSSTSQNITSKVPRTHGLHGNGSRFVSRSVSMTSEICVPFQEAFLTQFVEGTKGRLCP